jgi:hypothetical protein
VQEPLRLSVGRTFLCSGACTSRRLCGWCIAPVSAWSRFDLRACCCYLLRFLLTCLLCCQAAFAQQAADARIHSPPLFASIPYSTQHDTACCSDSDVGAAPAAAGEEGGADAASLWVAHHTHTHTHHAGSHRRFRYT